MDVLMTKKRFIYLTKEDLLKVRGGITTDAGKGRNTYNSERRKQGIDCTNAAFTDSRPNCKSCIKNKGW